ncbi:MULTISPECIES: alginate export family protein [Burkholderia cepacia complex]|uniref:alginate export family protein n=1 Tax=Burkholderia cepacia complex TaxID=87882 RepID=UPI002AAFB2B5|nr:MULTISPECIES: alginate export family protein [Burkholderia cepacia complex]
MHPILHTLFPAFIAFGASSSPASAYEFYNEGDTNLSTELKAGYGFFGVQRSYTGRPGVSLWHEGFVKYGLNGATDRAGTGLIYGAISFLGSATWGAGDPGGFTTGRERHNGIEDTYLGWKSGGLFPALGKNGLDFSVGRQVVKAGSGFLINDDGVNPGRGVDDGRHDRGGAYYLGPRVAFARTAVLRLGGADGWHGSAMWLRSNNHLQADTELVAGTLDYTAAEGTLGLTFVHGLGIDDRYLASPSRLDRKGMNTYSVRGEGNAGIHDADFAFEYAYQTKRSSSDNAWYAEAGYTFSHVRWRPSLSYRYTRYSRDFDALFQGGFRGRYQGEVASNYAFSYNANTQIHDVGLTTRPNEKLTATLMLFEFRTLGNRSMLNLDGRELTLYLDWTITDNFMLSPNFGVYKPRKYAANGGNQSGNAAANFYFNLILVANF